MTDDILKLISKLDIKKDSELISMLYKKYNSITIPKKYMSKSDFDEDDIFSAKKGADTIIRSFLRKLPETKKYKQARRISEECDCDTCKYINKNLSVPFRNSDPVCKSCFRRIRLVEGYLYSYEGNQINELRKLVSEDFIQQKMIIQKINQKLHTIKHRLKHEASKQ